MRLSDHHLYTPAAGKGFRVGRVLLMTATIAPPSGAVTRSDPRVRQADYLDALRRYMQIPAHVVDRIVFADNSASDLSEFIELVKLVAPDKTIELLSFSANDHSPSYGKAYGEFRLIDTALSLTSLISPGDRVWKTTGRLFCDNLLQLEMTSPARFQFVCDLFNVPFVRTGSWAQRTSMDLRLFAFQASAYDAWLRGAWEGLGSSFNEILMYRRMVAAAREVPVMPRFAVQPRIQGVSGRTERSYESPSQVARNIVRSVARRVVPGLWL